MASGMTSRASVHLPLGPLLDASGAYRAPTASPNLLCAPHTWLARQVDKPRRTVRRWVHEGVPIHAADEAAIACGFHPAEVWGGEYWSACFEQDRIEAPQREREEAARRAWVERVREYQAVERARERGPHRCAVDGCRCVVAA